MHPEATNFLLDLTEVLKRRDKTQCIKNFPLLFVKLSQLYTLQLSVHCLTYFLRISLCCISLSFLLTRAQVVLPPAACF